MSLYLVVTVTNQISFIKKLGADYDHWKELL